MNVQIHRIPSTLSGTFGVLCVDDIPVCLTCEDPWFENQKNVSCIPAGRYACQKFSGTRFKDVWQVTNVPNREAILIHSGNTINDTHGCILVGAAFGLLDGKPAVTASLDTLNMLRRRLPETFGLTIT